MGSQDGTVYAFDRSSGRQIWTFKKARDARNRPLAVGGLVLIGGFDGVLDALDAETGKAKWSFRAGKVDWEYRDKFINGRPVVVNGLAVLSSEDHNVYAVDLATGKEAWRRRLGEEPQALELPVVDGCALVGAWDGRLYSIDVKNGSVKWVSKTEFTPTGHAVWNGSMNVYKRATGEEKWLKVSQRPFLTCVPAFDDQNIYVSRWSGELLALSRKTGRQVWRFAPDTENLPEAGSRFYVALHNGIVVYGTSADAHIYGVEAKSGRKLWSVKRGAPLDGPFPVPGTGVALFAEEREQGLHGLAIDMKTGRELYSADGLVYLPSVIGKVAYAPVVNPDGDGFLLIGMDAITGHTVWTLSRRSN